MNHHSSFEMVIGQKIKTAFPKAFKKKRMTHLECVRLRPRLIAVSEDGFEEALAQVLLDLIETHTEKMGQSEDAEEVIRFLNVDEDLTCLESLPGYNDKNEHFLGGQLRSAKVASLADINSLQAGILVEWLKAVKSWPDMSWYRDEVEAALVYWTKRANID
jgi:hypothetical protein